MRIVEHLYITFEAHLALVTTFGMIILGQEKVLVQMPEGNVVMMKRMTLLN